MYIQTLRELLCARPHESIEDAAKRMSAEHFEALEELSSAQALANSFARKLEYYEGYATRANRPKQYLIEECDSSVIDYIVWLENKLSRVRAELEHA